VLFIVEQRLSGGNSAPSPAGLRSNDNRQIGMAGEHRCSGLVQGLGDKIWFYLGET
jgi:hypothetical protein